MTTRRRDTVANMMVDAYNESIRLSLTARAKATLFKRVVIAEKIILFLLGLAISVLGFRTFNDIQNYVIGVLGIITSAIPQIDLFFNFSKRSVFLNIVSDNLLKLSREIKIYELEEEPLFTTVSQFYDRLDQYDIEIFDYNITTSNHQISV